MGTHAKHRPFPWPLQAVSPSFYGNRHFVYEAVPQHFSVDFPVEIKHLSLFADIGNIFPLN